MSMRAPIVLPFACPKQASDAVKGKDSQCKGKGPFINGVPVKAVPQKGKGKGEGVKGKDKGVGKIDAVNLPVPNAKANAEAGPVPKVTVARAIADAAPVPRGTIAKFIALQLPVPKRMPATAGSRSRSRSQSNPSSV
jgi:hypothetical protein